jgi:hypothetical protein
MKWSELEKYPGKTGARKNVAFIPKNVFLNKMLFDCLNIDEVSKFEIFVNFLQITNVVWCQCYKTFFYIVEIVQISYSVCVRKPTQSSD